jgi:hypothetical protein
MFFDLPEELLRLIYEFDSTYNEIFDKTLQQIKQYYIYENTVDPNNSFFMVYDVRNKISYLTDSLNIPSWISISYRMSKNDIQQMIMTKNLSYNRNAFLDYDITIYEFVPNDRNQLHVL